MTKLTDRQKEILQFINKYFRDNGTLPQKAEMNRHFNWSSPASASFAVDALVKKGYLEFSSNNVGYRLSGKYQEELNKRALEKIKEKIKNEKA